MAYDIYPAVDENYNFPPEVRSALVQSTDVQTALTQSKNSAIAAINAALTGTVTAFAGSAAPTGWLLCDGSAVSRTTYAALFALIGTTYGAGDGATTFNLPNLVGRVVQGFDSTQAEFNALGKAGGEKAHVMSQTEMPSHQHTGGTSTNGAHSHGGGTGGVGDHSHTGYTDNQGTHSHGGGTYGVGDHSHGASTLSGFQTYQTTSATRTGLQQFSSGTKYYAISSTDINALNYGITTNNGAHSHGIGNDGGHTHNVQTYNAGGHNHGIGTDGDHSHSFTTNATGGGGAANVLQPYLTLNYLIHI